MLIVFDGNDAAISECGELIMSQGTQVSWVPDVYSAMGQLSTGNLPDRLIVDVRILDEEEMQFLQLAPRYHPHLRVTVAMLDGAAERLNGAKGKFETATLTEITDAALGIRSAVTADVADVAEVVEWQAPVETDAGAVVQPPAGEPAIETDADESVEETHVWPPGDFGEALQVEADELDSVDLPRDIEERSIDASAIPQAGSFPPTSRLSTDGGPDFVSGEPSLHEAVRQRMGGAQPVSSRRLPPGRGAPSPSPPPVIPTGPLEYESAITPEELDALLHDSAVEALRREEPE